MGDLRGAIADDMKEYEKLCSYFNEKPVYCKHGSGVDPYGSHAHKLKKLYRSGAARPRKSKKLKRR